MLILRLSFFLVYTTLVTSAAVKLSVKIGYLITGENAKYNSTLVRLENKNNIFEGLQIKVDLKFRVQKLANIKSPSRIYAQVCDFLSKEGPDVVLLTEECIPLCNQISELIIQANIPVIRADAGKLIRKQNFDFPRIFYLRPTIDDLEDALFTTIINYKITKCVLLCEEGFCGMKYLTKLSTSVKLEIHLLPNLNDEKFNENLELALKNIKESKIKQIVLQASSQTAESVIKSAMDHELVNFQYLWIVTCLMEILKNKIQYDATFLFLRPSNISNTAENKGFHLNTSYDNFLLEDAERVIVSAVKELALQGGVDNALALFQNKENQYPFCINGEIISPTNSSLPKHISQVLITGNSGVIGFTTDGRRLMETLDIVNPSSDGLLKLAIWYRQAENGSVFTPFITETKDSCILCNLTIKPLRIATLLSEPFMMLKESNDLESLTDNDRFEGFLVDLIEELSRRINFKYELYLTDDQKYGIKNNNSWNGLIKEIVEEKADIVLADLTVSSSREEAVDFSVPYLYLGTNILMRKPSPSPSHPLSFLEPMSYIVWISIVASCLAISIVLAIIGRISPYDWRGLHQRHMASSEEANHFSLMNSIWFVAAGLMQQGTEATPRSISARIVGATWWFFVLVMIASYTANMAAFLTVTNLHNPVEDIEDLLSQTDMNYGIPNSGEVYAFFRDSQIEPYESIFKKMHATESFLDKAKDGVDRACEENFALIYDSTYNIYAVNELGTCKLMTVGSPFDSKGYGIAFPTDSQLKNYFSINILKLKENEYIEGLKQRWDILDAPKDASNTVGNTRSVLGMNQTSGIFCVLAVGAVLGLLVSIVERIWFKARKSSVKKVTMKNHNHTLNVQDIGEQAIKFI